MLVHQVFHVFNVDASLRLTGGAYELNPPSRLKGEKGQLVGNVILICYQDLVSLFKWYAGKCARVRIGGAGREGNVGSFAVQQSCGRFIKPVDILFSVFSSFIPA